MLCWGLARACDAIQTVAVHPVAASSLCAAGTAPATPQAVRIEPAGARAVSTAARRLSTDLGTGAPPGGSAAGGQAGSVELDVGVEYEDGCQRSHVSRLALPVLPPVR